MNGAACAEALDISHDAVVAPGLPAPDDVHRAVEAICAARDLDPLTATTRRSGRELTGADGVTFILRAGETCYYADEDAIAPLWKRQRFSLNQCVSGW